MSASEKDTLMRVLECSRAWNLYLLYLYFNFNTVIIMIIIINHKYNLTLKIINKISCVV
jgi:hypothetical protein